MGLITISEAIENIKEHGINPVREPDRFTFGNREQCRAMFEQLFLECDRTVKVFNFLPEYENILQWMMDTKGTGLALFGDCGRGKSTILTGVVTMLFYIKKRKVLKPYQTFEIPDKIKEIVSRWAILVDEIGTEVQCSEWGEKYEGFNRIMDNAEAEMKPVFISTNLSKEQILSRYGVRTWERINRLCRVVQFKGESLR